MTRSALLFPGQGAQSVGMGVELAKKSPAAAALFKRASEHLSYDLLQLCAEGPAERLNSTVCSQPALFVCSIAALQQLQEENPEAIESAVATAGLSLGEYTALVFAGALDFDEGLRLVHARGQAMQDAADQSPSSMVSVLGLEPEQVESICAEARGDGVLEIANYLCPGNLVLSGDRAACQRAAELAEHAGAMKIIPLAVAGAFHTRLMQPAVERLEAALAEVQLRRPRIPVVSNVDARPHDDPDEIRRLLVQQVVAPVRWEDSMRTLIDELEVEICYEVGPGRVLRGLLKRIARKLPCENVAA